MSVKFTVRPKVFELTCSPLERCAVCQWHKYVIVQKYDGIIYVWTDLSKKGMRYGVDHFLHSWVASVDVVPECFKAAKEVGYLSEYIN